MSDKTRRMLKKEIGEIKAQTFECKYSDSDCFVNKVVPIIINIASEESEEFLIDIIIDCWSKEAEANRLGKYRLFEIHRRVRLSDADKMTLESFQDMLAIMETGEEDAIKQKWIKIAKEVAKDQKVVVTLLWLLVTISALNATLRARK